MCSRGGGLAGTECVIAYGESVTIHGSRRGGNGVSRGRRPGPKTTLPVRFTTARGVMAVLVEELQRRRRQRASSGRPRPGAPVPAPANEEPQRARRPRAAWDGTVTDLTAHRLTRRELRERLESRVSKNLLVVTGERGERRNTAVFASAFSKPAEPRRRRRLRFSRKRELHAFIGDERTRRRRATLLQDSGRPPGLPRPGLGPLRCHGIRPPRPSLSLRPTPQTR